MNKASHVELYETVALINDIKRLLACGAKAAIFY